MFQAEEIVNRVNAAKAGEMAAWNTLYQYYYPRLLNIALHYCSNSPLAKDLVQDSFITAFLKLNQLKDTSAFGAWLKQIVVRKCFRVRHKEYENVESVATSLIDWEQELEEAEKYTRLQAVISSLPEVLRTTLLLRYYSGRRSYQEIAEILSIPTGTVRSRLNEAKSKLAAAWKLPVENADRSVKDRDSWNRFYQETLSGLHHNAEQRRIFLEHLQQGTQVVAPGNRLVSNGRSFFAGMVADDQARGSWLKPVDIISSGHITVIDQAHYNSPEHPHHCPPSCVVIVYRNRGKAERVYIHADTR
jgi:RNA polymerase sigma factor (sigma-70 family)